jgi:hypothetical protein
VIGETWLRVPQTLLPRKGWSHEASIRAPLRSAVGYLPPRQGAYYISSRQIKIDRALGKSAHPVLAVIVNNEV